MQRLLLCTWLEHKTKLYMRIGQAAKRLPVSPAVLRRCSYENDNVTVVGGLQCTCRTANSRCSCRWQGALDACPEPSTTRAQPTYVATMTS